MEWLKLILTNLAGVVAIITLAVYLMKYIRKVVRERNWPQIVKMVTEYMERAEVLLEYGVDRKDYVLAMVKDYANTVNYDIDMEAVSQLIDRLCGMSMVVNAEKTTIEDEGDDCK